VEMRGLVAQPPLHFRRSHVSHFTPNSRRSSKTVFRISRFCVAAPPLLTISRLLLDHALP
jgi:hypothetical protein